MRKGTSSIKTMRFYPTMLFTFGLLLLSRSAAVAEDRGGPFIKEGDRWAFHGDSITFTNTYNRLFERVFRHFHPDTNVRFTNRAVWGKKLEEVKSGDATASSPTVVSIMLGMNDVINSNWLKGQPMSNVTDAYRKKMTDLVRDLKSNGITVLLMTPTLTDESARRTVFQIEGSRPVIEALAPIVREIAEKEGAFCIPMQEEFEAFQDAMSLREQLIRNDGVHPTSMGQYQIARVLWERLNVATPLTGEKRSLSEPWIPVPVTARLSSQFLSSDATSLDIVLDTPAPMDVTATWSISGDWRSGDSVKIIGRGSENLKLSGHDTWTLKIPAECLPKGNGDVANIVLDLSKDSMRSIFIIDIAKARVWHFKDGIVSGTFESDKDRPEGRELCKWLFKKMGKALFFEAEIFDSQIKSAPDGVWPWSGDALSLYLDLRPGERFGGIASESDVHLLWFIPREEPFFGVAFRPWLGKNLENASTHSGEKTDKGYRVKLIIDGFTDNHHQFDLGKLDSIGFHMTVVDADPGSPQNSFYESHKTKFPPDLYPNANMILDLKDKIPGDAVMNASIFPPPGISVKKQ